MLLNTCPALQSVPRHAEGNELIWHNQNAFWMRYDNIYELIIALRGTKENISFMVWQHGNELPNTCQVLILLYTKKFIDQSGRRPKKKFIITHVQIECKSVLPYIFIVHWKSVLQQWHEKNTYILFPIYCCKLLKLLIK